MDEKKREIKKTLVIGGGGVMGGSAISALEILKDWTINVDQYVGSSIGAVICLQLSIGYSPTEIIENSRSINKPSLVLPIDISLLTDSFGICTGENIINLMGYLLEKKGFSRSITFRQHYKLTGKLLTVAVMCLEDKKTQYINVHTNPKLELTTAIRMSAGVPILFTPVLYKKKHYIDGSTYDLHPYDFKNGRDNEVNCIVMREKQNAIISINGIGSYINAIVRCAQRELKPLPHWHQLYIISNFSSIQVDLTDDEEERLYEEGREYARKFIAHD
jgi:predicted acylesterase/phospholipase RssA